MSKLQQPRTFSEGQMASASSRRWPRFNVSYGSKTEIGPRNPDFRSSLNSRHSPTRRSRPKSADIAPRLAVFGLLGHVGNQASTRKTLGQKIRLQPCIRHTGRPRAAGARQRSNERRNGDAADAARSCPVRSGRYRPSCWRDPCRPRTDDAMPKSNSSRQTIKQVKARRS